LPTVPAAATIGGAMTTMTEHVFDADTAVQPDGDGRYAATLTDRWTALGGTPNGGYMLAVALRALQADMPFPDPLVTSAHFLRPGLVGPAHITTEVVRAGRRVATGQASLLQEDREIVRLLATFGDLDQANGRTHVVGEAPRLPAPDQIPDVLDGGVLPGVSITEQLEYRAPELPGWVKGAPAGEAGLEFWMRFRDGRDADPLALAALVDGAAPAVLDVGAPGSATMELTVHVRGRPAAGWLACRNLTRHVIGGYHEEDFEIWDSAGNLVAQSRQFALLPG
jgi:acyl-CoA thioesterase